MSTVCSIAASLGCSSRYQLVTHGFRSAIWPFHGAAELANGLGGPNVVPRIYASSIQRHPFSVSTGSSIAEHLCRGRHALRNPSQLAQSTTIREPLRGAESRLALGLQWTASAVYA